MPSWKKVIVSGSDASLNSLNVLSITGSLQGTASFATTASFVTPLNQNVSLTGSLNITGSLFTSGSVTINNTGTGNSFLVEDSANPDATPFTIDASGNTMINTTSSYGPLTVRGDGATGVTLDIDAAAGQENQSTRLFFKVSGSGRDIALRNLSGSLVIGTRGTAGTSSGTSVIVVSGSGNTGIGSGFSPSAARAATLQVSGNISIETGDAYKQDGSNVIYIAKGTDAFYANTISGPGAGTVGLTRQTAYGFGAGAGTTGSNQTAVGYGAGYQNSGSSQTAIGRDAGYQNSGLSQTAIGLNSGYQNSGLEQTAVGQAAGQYNTGIYQTAVGYAAGYQNSGSNQSTFGYAAGYQNTGSSQTAIGVNAGYKNSGSSQTVVGENAGYQNSGSSQTAIGVNAGRSNSGTNQTAVGVSAGQYNTGSSQTAFGFQAGYQNSGSNQTALGLNAGYQNIGLAQTVVGLSAGNSNDGANQTAVGYLSGYFNIGASRTALGYEAGRENIADYQTAIGLQAGYRNTGSSQTAVGYGAGTYNSASNQSALGYQAGYYNIGNIQTAIGGFAGWRNTGSNQTALGYQAGYLNQADIQTVVGYGAGSYNTGSSQIAFGQSAGQFNAGATQIAIGIQSGQYNTGSNQIAIGNLSGYLNSGSNNTGIGHRTGYMGTGSNNVYIGYFSGYYTTGATVNTGSSNSVFLGVDTTAGGGNRTNQIVIGYGASGIGSNSVVLGNDSITTTSLKGFVGIGTSSPSASLHIKPPAPTTSGQTGIVIEADAGRGINLISDNYNTNQSVTTFGRLQSSMAAFLAFGVNQTGSNTTEYQSSQDAFANRPTALELGNAYFALKYNTTSSTRTYGTNVSMSTSLYMQGGTGRLGIGTTTPQAILHVSSSGYNEQYPFLIGSNTLSVSSSGNVGIGTTTPSANLEVYGVSDSVALVNSAGNSYLKLKRGSINADAHISFDTTTTQKHIVGLINSTDSLVVGGTEAAPVITVSGSNVGIGTTSPSSKLHIATNDTSSNATVTISNSGSTGLTSSIEFLSTPTDAPGANRSGRIISLFDGGSFTNARTTIQSMTTGNVLIDTMTFKNGNVGIGTITPSEKLHVSGNLILSSSTSTKININSAAVRTYIAADGAGTSFGSLSNHNVNFYSNNAERMRILSTGEVGIGTTTPNARLDVSGSAIISGSLTTTSSVAFKAYTSVASFPGTAAGYLAFDATGNVITVAAGNPFPYTGSAQITGSLGITGSLTVTSNINNTLFTSTTATANVGSTTIYSISTSSYDGAWFEYVARSGSNARAGQIMAIDSSSAVNFTETTTTDFGSTSGLSLGVYIVNGAMALTASAATAGWSIKTIVRSI